MCDGSKNMEILKRNNIDKSKPFYSNGVCLRLYEGEVVRNYGMDRFKGLVVALDERDDIYQPTL